VNHSWLLSSINGQDQSSSVRPASLTAGKRDAGQLELRKGRAAAPVVCRLADTDDRWLLAYLRLVFHQDRKVIVPT
jgi:hypothetical protein